MTTCVTCVPEISEVMIVTVMVTDMTLLAAALIVVSLIDVGLGSGKAFSVASGLRHQRARRLARLLQVFVATSVGGFLAGILTIWFHSAIIKLITILLGTAAALEFGIITLLILAILLSEKKDV